MCYSAEVWTDYNQYVKEFGADILLPVGKAFSHHAWQDDIVSFRTFGRVDGAELNRHPVAKIPLEFNRNILSIIPIPPQHIHRYPT